MQNLDGHNVPVMSKFVKRQNSFRPDGWIGVNLPFLGGWMVLTYFIFFYVEKKWKKEKKRHTHTDTFDIKSGERTYKSQPLMSTLV